MSDLSNEAVDEALDTILRSVGSSPIKSYMPLSQERARKAMRDLIAKHQQSAVVIPIVGKIGK